MLQAFANVVRIKELRTKLLITMGLLAIARIGVFIPMPGVNLAAIRQMMENISEGLGEGVAKVVQLIDLFAGGGLSQASIFALGIMPYISASIIFQVLVAVVPTLERIAKEGESGRRRITQYTRYSTVGLCLVQGFIICNQLAGQQRGNMQLVSPDVGYWSFVIYGTLAITAGSTFLMWLGEQIDEFGIGSGISLIIMAGIVAQLPKALLSVAQRATRQIGGGAANEFGPDRVLVLLALFFGMIVAVVLITQAQRRIPMNHARKTREGFTQRNFLPLRVNNSGVIAIIFAQSLMMVPSFFALVPNETVRFFVAFISPWNFFYIVLYMSLILFFQYFYTAITFNPKEHAEQFKGYGAFIPGIRPGRKTAEYLEYVMNRICLAGGVAMAVIAVVPQIISSMMAIDLNTASFFGGTGLLIIVGVALDLVQRIENHMMMQHYEGFIRGGKPLRGGRR